MVLLAYLTVSLYMAGSQFLSVTIVFKSCVHLYSSVQGMHAHTKVL